MVGLTSTDEPIIPTKPKRRKFIDVTRLLKLKVMITALLLLFHEVTTVCPDGTVDSGEQGDDYNNFGNDGCTNGVIDFNYICTGGPSVCNQGPVGQAPNIARTSGIANVGGDGQRNSLEEGDDSNTSPNDGCTNGVIDTNYICTGEPSVCAQGPFGEAPDLPKTAGMDNIGGDGLRNSLEEGDDSNADPDDGCTNGVIDDNWICTGEPSSCNQGTGISVPNIPKTSGMDNFGGDGLKNSLEEGDDGNDTNLDGGDDTGFIESDYIGIGGTDTSGDTCTKCTGGTSPNLKRSNGAVQGEDGRKHTSEECDDGNNSDPGGDSSGNISDDYACKNGDENGPDSGTYCPLSGESQNTAKDECIALGGDGRKHASELCEPGTTPNMGCDSTMCTIQPGFVCTGGNSNTPDTCTLCSNEGGVPNVSQDQGVGSGGDGKKHSSEECEPGAGPGCNSSTCTIEPDYIGTGGTTSTADNGAQCIGGTSPNSSKDNGEVQCGDGKRHSSEEGDDDNTIAGDGGDNSGSIETGYACTGGTETTMDTGKNCFSLGKSPNVAKDSCEPLGGDGMKHSTEQCEPGTIPASNPGCNSSTCTIEDWYVCSGGTISSQDTCTLCPSGESPNDSKTMCIVQCADGRIGDSEFCDDGNLQSGDGCSAIGEIEDMYTCSGEPSICIPICGDGKILNGEKGDDGNKNDEDGCSATGEIEEFHGGTGEPSVCKKIAATNFLSSSEQAVGSAAQASLALTFFASMAASIFLNVPTDGLG